jgi:hypothetical protein
MDRLREDQQMLKEVLDILLIRSISHQAALLGGI